MDNLNEEQRYAATFSGKHLLVLAGAGTGKTHTIIARASHLIKSGVNPKRILILSFTRKSAKEIVERISAELPDMQSEGLQGATFHSWCMSIIKNHPNVFPEANYTLLDEDGRESCFNLLCGRDWSYKGIDNKKIAPKTISEVYSYWVNVGCSLSDAIRMKIYDNALDTLDVKADLLVLQGVLKMYHDYKRSRKYIDYDDILLIVSKYLKKDENLRKNIAGLYEHILIDEMQDTNPLQYELLSSFYEDCSLFCVGDDAQSIYGFRGADFKTIHNFVNIVPDSEVCKLTVSYRSTQEILDLSNWVLANSPLQYDKKLTAFRGAGEKPRFVHWGDEWEEGNDIAKNILIANEHRGKKWKDNMILSRSAWGMKKVEGCLIKHKIPYVIFGGNSLMSSRHIRDVVAPMRIVSNYLDELAWSRYLQIWNKVGPVTAAKIIGEVIEKHTLDDSLMALVDSISSRQLDTAIYETLFEISDLQYNPSKAIRAALRVMSKRLEEIYQKENWNTRKKDFQILSDVAKKTGSISEFVSEYVLDPSLETTEKVAAKTDDKVVLSTIHSAKGLEADMVYLLNASTKSYPTPRAILNGEDNIEEERRCLYVALTRAKDSLRVYRDVHSIHISSEDEKYYFFNELPGELYKNEIIASNYYYSDRSKFEKPVECDIYGDLNFD